MKTKVVCGAMPAGESSLLTGIVQPYLYPGDLLSASSIVNIRWTCVRTRPRWEKKFAHWLQDHRRPYFLPIFRHVTTSGRKRRTSELPLFPGFVFMAEDVDKKDLAQTGMVAYVLKPRGGRDAEQLHGELRSIWCGLTSGVYVTPVRTLAVGESCRISAGPLQGVEARFERQGRQGRLILQVEMMGGGISIDLPETEVDVLV